MSTKPKRWSVVAFVLLSLAVFIGQQGVSQSQEPLPDAPSAKPLPNKPAPAPVPQPTPPPNGSIPGSTSVGNGAPDEAAEPTPDTGATGTGRVPAAPAGTAGPGGTAPARVNADDSLAGEGNLPTVEPKKMPPVTEHRAGASG